MLSSLLYLRINTYLLDLIFAYLFIYFLVCSPSFSVFSAKKFIWQVQAFAAALESNRVTVSTRQTRGLDADAACGQLRNKFQKSPLPTDSDNLQPEEDVAVAC